MSTLSYTVPARGRAEASAAPLTSDPMDTAPLMLGVSGLRGIVGESLTPDVVVLYAGALATWLHARPRSTSRPPAVVVADDARRGGALLTRLAADALCAAGCDVIFLDSAMTPTVGFAVDQLGVDAGLIVTASHNPQAWNGLKIIIRQAGERRNIVSASAPPASAAQEIIELYRRGRFTWRSSEQFGHDESLDAAPERHAEAITNLLNQSGDLARIRRRRFRVALDTVGGVGGLSVPGFLEALACRVNELYPFIKHPGMFPHIPEPTRENLTALCRATRRHKADIGLAIDPDGDRLAIVDNRGRYIGEEYTLALAAESILASSRARPSPEGQPVRRRTAARTPVLVTNLSTSRMLDDIAARYNARIVRTPVGEANVVDAMKREKAAGNTVILGGEGNGGVIWPKVTYIRDSLSAIALVLSLMARTGATIADLVAQIPAYSIEKRKVDLARREDAQPAIEALAAAYRDQQIDTQDGIRIDFTARRAWLHIRPSNTEPIMRLIAEAPTAAEASQLLDAAAAIAATAR